MNYLLSLILLVLSSSLFFLKGFGLVCHRAIREICIMLGIKDIYAKCEGPTRNALNLTRAFFIGLMKQVNLCSFLSHFFLNNLEIVFLVCLECLCFKSLCIY